MRGFLYNNRRKKNLKDSRGHSRPGKVYGTIDSKSRSTVPSLRVVPSPLIGSSLSIVPFLVSDFVHCLGDTRGD